MEEKIEEKFCEECGQFKSLIEFNKKTSSKDGLSKNCKECNNKAKRISRSKILLDPNETCFCEDCKKTKSIIEFKTKSVCKKCYYVREKLRNIENRITDIVEKECCDCHKILPIEQFSKCASHKDGYASNCKECASKYLTIYREENHEKIVKQKSDSYYADPNRLQKGADYREENREKIRQWDRAYNKKNRKKKTARDNIYKKKRRKRDPVYRAYENAKGVARTYINLHTLLGKRNRSHEYISKDVFKTIGYCPSDNHHLDHIIPLRAFDPNNVEMLKLAHMSCNLRWIDEKENMNKNDTIIWSLIESSEELLKISNILKLTKSDDGQNARNIFPIIDYKFVRRM